MEIERIGKKVGKKAGLILACALLLYAGLFMAVGHKEAYANIPSSMSGRVYMTVGGNRVYLPEVRIHRLDNWHYDYCGGGDCYGYLHGVEVRTDANGYYHMGNSGNVPAPVCSPGSGAWLCPTGVLNEPQRTGCDQGLNWCGYNCGSNPHIWRAYFRDGYSWIKNNYPQVPFKDNDIDGGGTWVLRGSCGAGEEQYDGATWWRKSFNNDRGYEGCGFEWIPPACDLTCTASANPSTISHVGGGTITLTANVQGNVGYDRIDWSWKPGTQPCGTLREDPNDEKKAYVDFTANNVCTGQVVALATNSCTTSCGTSFQITNAAPNVVSVTPSSGLSGTEPNSDNGPTCSDRNPQIYTVRYRDTDGCADISKAYLWIDNVVPSIQQLHSSARASVQKSGGVWRIYGLRCSSGCDQVGNYHWDLGGVTVSQFEPSTPYLYFPNTALMYTDCTSKASGCSDSVAGVRPFAASCSGNDLTVKYKVWYYEDRIANNLNLYGYVSDTVAASDGWDDIGNWSLDFDLPHTSISAQHEDGDDPDTVRFSEAASELGVYDSGLTDILDRRYWIIHDDGERSPADPNAYYSAGPNVAGLGSISTWSAEFGPVSGLQGGDTVFAEMFAVDAACNMGDNPYQSEPIGEKWIQTYLNSVYGWSGYYDPIPSEDEFLSSFWLGGGATACVQSNFGAGRGSEETPWWCSGSYDDRNRRTNGGDWYDQLYFLALRSDWVVYHQNGEITETATISFGDGNDQVYKYVGEDPLVVSGQCRGRKVVFAPSGSAVRFVPEFVTAGEDDACLIIGEDGTVISVLGGSEAPDDEDDLMAAVITDGLYVSQQDAIPPTYDRLFIDGFVFSEEASFLRDLVFEDNMEHPSERISYDPRYLYLLKDMLGRKHFTDFECGIVKESKLCEGW